MIVLAITGSAQGAVNLGTAQAFAVLANTTVTNTGSTTINGNVGLYPGTSVSGFTDVTLNGTLNLTDGVAQQALIDAATTYGVLQGRTPCTDLSGQVLGQTVGTAADPLLPGVYCFSSSAQLTGDLYVSGGGEYIFQIGSTLTTASGSRVILQSGAESCNIFWAVGSSATLGTTSEFAGTLIANVSITANTGATVEGRLFAITGAVTLRANTITRPVCATTTTTLPPGTSTTLAPGTTTTTIPSDGAFPSPGSPVPPSGTTVPTTGTKPSTVASPLARTGSDLIPMVTLSLLAIALGALVRRGADRSWRAVESGVNTTPTPSQFRPIAELPTVLARRARSGALDPAASDALSAFEEFDASRANARPPRDGC